MSYQQPARRRLRQPSSSAVIVTGAVLAILAMVAVITIGRQHSRQATPPWLIPPQAPIPLLSEPPEPSAAPSTAAAATLSRLPVSRPSAPVAGPGSTPARTPVRLLPEPGTRVSLVATGTTDLRLRHQDFRMRLTVIGPRSPGLARADSTFVLRRGLADAQCISLEAVNYPGWFMRHQNFVLRLQPRQQSPLYAADATFCPQAAGPDADFLLRSVNFPDRYLAAHDTQLLLSPIPATSAQRFRATAGLPLDAGAHR